MLTGQKTALCIDMRQRGAKGYARWTNEPRRQLVGLCIWDGHRFCCADHSQHHEEREVEMKQLRHVSQTEKILFPIAVTSKLMNTRFFLPSRIRNVTPVDLKWIALWRCAEQLHLFPQYTIKTACCDLTDGSLDCIIGSWVALSLRLGQCHIGV